MTDLSNDESIDALKVAKTQRRMLIGFGAAILTVTVVQTLYPMLRTTAGEDMESPYAIGQAEVIMSIVEVVALAAFLIPAFQLIPLIGWSTLNKWAFVLICLISLGCGPLLLLAVFLINQQANRILRSHDVTVGLLGVSGTEIDRLREARGG